MVESADPNARVRVPAGALAATTLIRIRELPEDRVPPVLRQRRRISRTYSFEPDGLRFRVPVRVEIFFDDEVLPPGVGLDALTIGRVDAAGRLEQLADIEILPGPEAGRAVLQLARRGLGGTIAAFSPFAVWVAASGEPLAAGGRRGLGERRPARDGRTGRWAGGAGPGP